MGLCKQGISSEACPSRTFSYYKLITFRKALGEKIQQCAHYTNINVKKCSIKEQKGNLKHKKTHLFF